MDLYKKSVKLLKPMALIKRIMMARYTRLWRNSAQVILKIYLNKGSGSPSGQIGM
jgi:hypothetical protein